jgi:hypothetical protein
MDVKQLVGGLAERTTTTRYNLGDFGTAYRKADEQMSVSTRDPMFPDPALVERGNRGHAKAQNALANRVAELGYSPLSPNADEPNYDLAWVAGTTLWLAEVKSLTDANEERQLRLALGQVLRYADLVERQGCVSRPVIMAERKPTGATWQHLCERLGVLLLWPDRLALLPALIGLNSDRR